MLNIKFIFIPFEALLIEASTIDVAKRLKKVKAFE